MAILADRTVTGRLGEDVTFRAYIRLQDVIATKDTLSATFKILKEDRSMIVDSVLLNFEHDVSSDADNVWTQAYNKLKEMPEFSNAEDV